LIDGNELTESWFQSLRSEVRNIVRKSNTKPSGKESKKAKEEAKQADKQKPGKKTPAAVTGLQKYLLNQKDVKLGEGVVETIKSLKTVDEARQLLQGNSGNVFRDIMHEAGRLSDDGKAIPGDGSYMAQFGLTEDELKSSRTWDPHFFKVKPKEVSHERTGEENGAAGSKGSGSSDASKGKGQPGSGAASR
jgi:hypothetical protein